MRRLPIAFILAIFLPLICACGDEPRDYGDFLTDIVTYEGSSDDGTAMFSFQTRDDLPLQRLASSIKLPSDIVAGQRCLLRYTVVGNLADGTRQVRADGFAIIPTDGARKAPHSDMSTFPETEISVTSLWRSGTFINLNGWLPYSGKNYQLMLVADEQTLGSPFLPYGAAPHADACRSASPTARSSLRKTDRSSKKDEHRGRASNRCPPPVLYNL